MPDTLHNVQQTVNGNNAHGALSCPHHECDNADMRLAAIRKARGLSQRDLGEMIGKNASTITRAEKMDPTAKLATYIACADVLGVTLEDIFGNDVSPLERQIIDAFRAMPDEKKQRAAELLDLVAGPQTP